MKDWVVTALRPEFATAPFPQRSSRVVSVRLDTETINRLDRLAERTSCSRGFYLKAAIQAMLPALEENYWTQQATTYEESVIDREFRTIMDHALHPEDRECGPTRQA